MAIGALVVFASVIVRLTPSIKDDEILDKIEGFWVKAVSWLPTIGINPRTKELIAAMKAMKESVKSKEPVDQKKK